MKSMRRFRKVFFAILCGMLLSCATGLSQDRSHASVGLFYNADEYGRLMRGDDVLTNYTGAIEENRATRIVLSPRQAQDQTARILDSIDALLVPGGADIDPKFYKEARHPELEEPVAAGFDGCELAGIRRAEARGIPILGICRGLQLLNVGAGGTLYQDLPSELGTKVRHRIRDEQGKSLRCVHYITIFSYFIGQALGTKSGAGATAVSAAESSFDVWVDAFSAEWVRGDPMLATSTQYFDGAEQDALDRRLTPTRSRPLSPTRDRVCWPTTIASSGTPSGGRR